MNDPAAALAALVWCPFPDRDSAQRAATALLDARLIACANIAPGIESLFNWRGERGAQAECGVVFKTAAARLDAAMAALVALHPYETPAVSGWTVTADPGTIRWLEEETRPA